jgi:Bacterial virulence protein (VirJ)
MTNEPEHRRLPLARGRPGRGRVERGRRCRRATALAAFCLSTGAVLAAAEAPTTVTLILRGRDETLRLYGPQGGRVAVVASGDGGWIHLGPDVAEYLAGGGWRVVGFDSKAYLSSFTTRQSALSPADVAADFAVLADHARAGATGPPVLIGVSEGAGLAVLAATDSAVKARIAGIVALGLPDQCELAWHWKDSLIYVTKGVPKEPMFSTAEVIGRVAPVPVVAIHSTKDEFVSEDDVRRVMSKAGQPSQLWFVEAQNHRFGGNTGEFQKRLLQALDWIQEQRR